MNRTLFIALGLLIFVVLAGFVVAKEIHHPTAVRLKKTPHFESATPGHNDILAAVPLNVVVDFNFDLAEGSDISIKNSGKEYGIGATTIDDNKLALRRKIDPSAPEGSYAVTYKACWPDKSCHTGSYAFAIRRTKASTYSDRTGKSVVTIQMKDITFDPQNIRVSKGTKITWVNDDDVEHFVNTDAHPSHTYYPAMNSRGLAKGESFTITLDQPGIYPYHCSAHAHHMTGSIIVE